MIDMLSVYKFYSSYFFVAKIVDEIWFPSFSNFMIFFVFVLNLHLNLLSVTVMLKMRKLSFFEQFLKSYLVLEVLFVH